MHNKRHHIILILSLIILKDNIHLNLAEDNKNVYEALSLVVQEKFLKKTRPLLFYANFDKKIAENYFVANDIINGMLHTISNATYKILYNKPKLYFNLKHNEVVLFDSVKTVRKFYSKMKYIGNMDLARTVLFISSLKTVDVDTIYLIFKDLYYMQMLRVSLVIRLSSDDIIMLTYFPFSQKDCRDFQPVIINTYLADQHRWANKRYFPLKLKNFFGCPIYCCTWKEMPYFGVEPNRKNANITDYVGLDASVLKYAASALNFTIVIRWIDPINKDIESTENVLSKIFQHDCSVAVGGFTYKKGLDDTAVFSQTRFFLFSHICIVTNIIDCYTTYQKLALPFHYTVWLALGLTFALSSLLIYTCGRERQWSAYRNFLIGSANNAPQFHLYAVAVGANMTVTHMPKRNFARFLLTCWLLLTFILRTAYQSGMYQMLRDNKHWNPPETIENVFEQKYVMSTTQKNHKYLEILPNTERVYIFNSTVLEAFNDMLTSKEPKALIVPYEFFGYFGLKNLSQWRNLHLVRERVLTQQLTIYVRRHSYLIPVLDPIISYAEHFGFLTIWNRKNVLPIRSALKFTAAAKRNNNGDTDKKPLSMDELGAIFLILVWLHVFATIVFIIELTWHRFGNAVKNSLICRRE